MGLPTHSEPFKSGDKVLSWKRRDNYLQLGK